MGKILPNESVISQLCALSGDDPGVIAAQIQAARSKTPEAVNMWNLIAKRLAGGASTAILSVCFAIALIAAPASDARASTLNAYKTGEASLLYIVSSTFLTVGEIAMVRLRQWAGFFRLCLAANL
jgi:hypothetical protein